MESDAFIRAKLVNYSNADCSDVRVSHSRYYYSLKFEEDIGWDWIRQQISKVNKGLDVTIEPYKIRPSGMHAFEIEIREMERRADIDDDQESLFSFE